MKIQCDVCEKAPATIICCADEAVLCADCDVEVHAANKLASKHQRLLLLQCLSNNLPRCDICQEKAAFIFCVEDRALFCRDCDETIHTPDSLSGNHQRFLAAGIRVALSSACSNNRDSKVSTKPSNHHNAQPVVQKVPMVQQITSSSAFAPSGWSVDDEFLQLPDYESSNKRKFSVGFGELEWFADVGLFNDQMPEEALAAAEVPELPISPASSCASFCRPAKSMSLKKPRIEISDDEEYFVVPDLGLRN